MSSCRQLYTPLFILLFILNLYVEVQALYPYSGHGLEVKKGESMFLLDKTNADWWNIRYVSKDAETQSTPSKSIVV